MALRQRVSLMRNVSTAIRVATRPGSASLAARGAALPRMIRATVKGDYRGVSVPKLLALAAAVGYVVSPVDLLPEAVVPLLGLVDDAVVLSWFAANFVEETEAFLAWESSVGERDTTAHPADRDTGGAVVDHSSPSTGAAAQIVPGQTVSHSP